MKNKNKNSKLKLDIKQIRERMFEIAIGYVCMNEEYISKDVKLKFRCPQGHEFEMLWNNFLRGQRCKTCINIKKSIEYDFKVKNVLLNLGAVFIKFYHKNNKRYVNFTCDQGHDVNMRCDSLLSGHICWECANKIRSEKLSLSYDYVKQYIEVLSKTNYKLISLTYKNAYTPIQIQCDRGHIYYTCFSTFQKGHRCLKCFNEDQTGENSVNWNGGLSNLADYLRHKIKKWKRESAEFYSYKCILTGKNFDTVHHLYSFNTIVSETLKILQLPTYINVGDYTSDELMQIEKKCLELHDLYGLGVCLSNEIHNLFHSIYGRGNNTPEQFEEFKLNYINNINCEVVAC